MNGNCEKFYVAKVVKAPYSKEEKEKEEIVQHHPFGFQVHFLSSSSA